MEATKLQNDIQELNDAIEVEKLVSKKIQDFIKKKKEAMFDAEHFFDGYKSNRKFALECLKTAFHNKARWIILCDTNGGTLPKSERK